ncbi:SDR family NAD(P)-dependent oxidoreductase [Neptunitalea lumnitzerae]|uniref:Ketoacyl reductase n=1 Tax=Neptunitalea lumnitzerae TaxID=2965509 RepID=A0ABQ5MLR1_9FLAO|nr:SDR family oxidoreductase [Neptunitalea sp. Y10]GLB50348.1 ketoacyl reductase [Neptunitalea sp. Y10]
MNLNIENKTAVITGGDSGIGLETAKILTSEGVKVILTDINEEDLKEAKSKIKNHNSDAVVYSKACDLTNFKAVDAFAEMVKKEYGGADILVNCAGARGAAGDFLELTDEDWQKTIDIDLMGAVRICRAFIPQMREKKWGRIILIASENAFQPYVDESPYNACKAGVINLSKCLSRSYGKEGILVNTVSPAFIETPMTDAMMEQLAEERDTSMEEAVEYFLENDRPHLTAGRRGKPEEVAAVISFLCSEQASYVNGSNYRVDSGAVESAFG